ncbi:MAG: ABC-2 family transporter protein, partial [Chloroflexi bacterium]|nr:ABC-2 family transporter protein [Chloroflexota bacterium]
VAGYSVQGAVTYTGLTQMLLAYLPLYGWWELMLTIQTGEIAADLSRPVDFFLYWLAQDVGRAACQFVMRGLPILALYALFYSLALPPTPWHAAAFVVSLVLALLVSFAWRFLVSLSAFWTPDARGVGRTAWTVAIVLSGFMMPVAFFPPWAEALMRLTPFPSLINTEVEIYLGIVGGPALLGALAGQLFWFLALAALSRLVLAAGVKKLVIQGG